MTTETKSEKKYFESVFDTSGEKLCDDLYLLDYIEDFSAVAYRHSSERLSLRESFLELLGCDERKALREYIYDESTQPLILKTSRGTAVIDKHLTPSSQVMIVSFLCEEKRSGSLAEYVASGKTDSCVTLEKYRDNNRKRFSVALRQDLESAIGRIQGCFENDYMSVLQSSDEIVKNFGICAERAASLAGCCATLRCDSEISLDERFDFYAFEGFLISMLLLTRRISRERRADIEIGTCFDGVMARVELSVDEDINVFSLPEIFTFFELSNRQNMLFEASCENGRIRVGFSPSRKDWSYLEIKMPYGYDWRK